MQQGTIIRVFVASPGDVKAEREIVCKLIQEWNRIHSKSRVIAEAIRWETHSRAASGDHPQKIIDRQLLDDYECDVLIAVFWSRLGLPTDTHQSGTIEEIAYFSQKQSKDRVMLFFCEWPIPMNHDHDQLLKVRQFRNEAGKIALYQSVATNEAFESVVRDNLHKVLSELVENATDVNRVNNIVSTVSPPPVVLYGQRLQAYCTVLERHFADESLTFDTLEGIEESLSGKIYDLTLELEVSTNLNFATRQIWKLKEKIDGRSMPEQIQLGNLTLEDRTLVTRSLIQQAKVIAVTMQS